ncbi:MAG: phospho-sugar mutase [Bifidobacteriaceae bacterium]|jgi:phosphomannomutase|nr:phospho-sugar mutase [Bifidobacteriaceae bacterium]
MMVDIALEKKVLAWIEGDVSDEDIALLRDTLAKAKDGDVDAKADLESKFEGTLEFGTAGLRGVMEPGAFRMNRAVVIKAAAGLATFCNKKVEKPKIVIGYDARHHSEEFAVDSAGVFLSAGLDVHLMPRMLPTPVLAYAVRAMDADAGVMVTASHNPAKDNGYKVYLGSRIVTDNGRGSQIVPPFDTEIADEIAKIGAANWVPRALSGWNVIPDGIVTDYYADVKEKLFDGLPRSEKLNIATSAMHGVGGAVQVELLHEFGFDNVKFVPEQQEPNPDFPTVVFPNPEEKGTMDMVLALAESEKSELILANDPDADRLGAGIFDKHTGKYRQLMGDETGMMIGYHVAKNIAEDDKKTSTLASSIVSSRTLQVIAEHFGLLYEPTLTGFKWISRANNLVFGYEEAIGFLTVPDLVHDKDGPSAGVLLAQIANEALLNDKTLSDVLDDIAREIGLYTQAQVSIRLDSKEKIDAAVESLRTNPPKTLGKSPVVNMRDALQDNQGLPPTNAIILTTEDNTRVIARPSGTEPKAKFYIETYHAVHEEATFEYLTALRFTENARISEICEEIRAFA